MKPRPTRKRRNRMGMFTSISHPDDGRELQIKTGNDQCDIYKVGDTIPWKPNPWFPGDHIDGAYPSYSDKGRDDWVVVKDCIIVAVEPVADRSGGTDRARLEAQYKIALPDPNLWSPADWAAKAERMAAFEAEYDAFKKERGLSDDEQAAVAFYMHRRLKQRSFASLVLPPRKVKRDRKVHHRRRSR